jgi:hypothetical protein
MCVVTVGRHFGRLVLALSTDCAAASNASPRSSGIAPPRYSANTARARIHIQAPGIVPVRPPGSDHREPDAPPVGSRPLPSWTDPIPRPRSRARRRRADPRQQRPGTKRYRLNRYGDRRLNRALHIIVQSRIRYDDPIRDHVARRTSEGKTGREIKRCLSCYIARHLSRLLERRPVRRKLGTG